MNGTETMRATALLLALTAPPVLAQTDEQKKPATILTGVAVDEKGEPVAGAAIGFVVRNARLNTKELLASPQHTTNAKGEFSVPKPDGKYGLQIVLAAKGRQACAATVVSRASEQARFDLGQFVMPRGATLVGRVRDADGKPLADVDIHVSSAVTQAAVVTGLSRQVLSGGVSNARGIFQVPCVPRTGLQLKASKAGYQHRVVLVSHESPLSLTLEAAPQIKGRLVDESGAPIVGATMSLREETGYRWHHQSIKTAEDGTYTLSAPPSPARYRVTGRTSKPLRMFESKLLHGEQNDPELSQGGSNAKAAAELIVHAVDKKTGKRLSKFWVALSGFNLDNLQTTMFHADGGLRQHEEEARYPLTHNHYRGVIVVAAGYATRAVELPENIEEPMVVELGPGAVIKGRVVDDQGKPVAGVAVRALPDGRSSGSGGSISKHWPRTDKDGRYRIDCLPEGKHQLQVYPNNRIASDPQVIETTLKEEVTLDFTIASERKLTLKVTGDLPPGPTPVISNSGVTSGSGKGFRHHVPPPPPITLRRNQESYDFGIQQDDRITLHVYLPSRTRVGTGTTIPLDRLKIEDGSVDVQLPELGCSIMRGRVEVDTQLPTARIGVMASPVNERQQRIWYRQRNVLCGLFADGSFEMDLPNGEYILQLVDVATGIVFHTEANDHAANAEKLVIRPELHWLELDLQPEEDGGRIVIEHFNVELDRPRNGIAFMDGHSSRGRASQSVTPRSYPMETRWLVPEGNVKVDVQQAPDRLRPGGSSYRYSQVASGSLEVTKTEQKLTLRIPAPPSDEELEKPKDQ